MEMIITTENPEFHWGFVNVKNRTILDLGCGRVWSNDRKRSSDKHLHWQDTPEFFLNRGAKKVIGVDSRTYEIERYKDDYFYNSQNSLFLVDEIKSSIQIESYLEKYKPDCVKCDIEHNEIILKDVNNELFASVKEWYIECHTNELYQIVSNKLLTNNFSCFYLGYLIYSNPDSKVIGFRLNV